MFQPGAIGSLQVRNRLVMPAMATNFASAHGEPTARQCAYYTARAHGGVGLIVVENASTDEPAGSNGTVQLRLDHDRYIPALSWLAQQIQEAGAAAAIQINHAGVVAQPHRTGVPAVGPSAIGWTEGAVSPVALSLEEIEQTIQRYAQAAVRAQRAGFDAVEIHGAHGYLIAQFLSPITNRRHDAFGGSPERRWQFAIDLVRATRNAVGPGYPLLFRLSADELMPGGRKLEESVAMAPSLVNAGIDALSVSAGTPANPEVQLEPISYEEGWRSYLAAAMRKQLSVPVITAGVFRHPDTVERALAQGEADYVAIGRGLIADPEWPNKARSGRSAEIRRCISCNRCVRQRVFDDLPIRCSVNPHVGLEAQAVQSASLPEAPRHVLVVGGGPAGLQAATTAAQQGARVSLYERSASLGGQLQAAALPPHKAKIDWAISDLLQALPPQVEVHLETEVSVAQLRETSADVVVLATGSTPAIPSVSIAEDAPVQTALALLVSMDSLTGQAVVVLGAGMVGCETALACAARGARVTLIEAESDLAVDCEPITRSVLLRELGEQSVVMLTEASVVEIDSDAVVAQVKGLNRRIPADRIVFATGSCPDAQLNAGLEKAGFLVEVIGDAREPRGIAEAVYEGWRAGQRASMAPQRTRAEEE